MLPRPYQSAVDTRLDAAFFKEFCSVPWDAMIPHIYLEITCMPRSRRYCTTSAVNLVRFVKNSYSHVPGATRSRGLQLELLDKFVYLDIIPALLVTVFDIVMKYVWNGREEIKGDQ